jgi:hypothetical protein
MKMRRRYVHASCDYKTARPLRKIGTSQAFPRSSLSLKFSYQAPGGNPDGAWVQPTIRVDAVHIIAHVVIV